MFKFFLDIFCKDTIIGLSQLSTTKRNRIYKNKPISCFKI